MAGATGVVGQQFVYLLQDHPTFELTELIASERSKGKNYGDACNHKMGLPVSKSIAEKAVVGLEEDLDCELVFSALPSQVAGKIETRLAMDGLAVSSNAGAHRMEANVPLVIPEVNPDHFQLIKHQKTDGFIVTNPNCTTSQLVLALKPLEDGFGLEGVLLTSMQALSGAGYPGVASLDVIDNVLPFIQGEEEKVESETLKLLGTLKEEKIVPADIAISASCNRVNVFNGHLECVSVKLKEKTTVEAIKDELRNFRGLPQKLKLPSAPPRPIIVMNSVDRPQPRLDRDIGQGMASVVGRIRKDVVLDFKFIVLGHNLIRGAAGASILNAELLHAMKYI